MRYLIGVLCLMMTALAFADSKLSTKDELKQLYNQINVSSTPHSDQAISTRIGRLMRESCMLGAKKALAKQPYSEQKKAYANAMIVATCGCVADSHAVQAAVVDSAILLKKHGPDSPKSREVLIDGIRKAKNECVMKILSTMKKSNQNTTLP